MFQNSTLPSVSADIASNIAGSLPRIPVWQGLAQLDRLVPLPRTFREYVAWLLILVGVSALALLQVWATLQISQTRMESDALYSQYVLIEQENAQLLWEISHYTTLERIETDAVAAGFVPALKRRYVTPIPVAAGLPAPVIAPALADQPQSSGWSLDVNTDAREIGVGFSQVWDAWEGQWQALGQTIGDGAAGLTGFMQQQLMQLDMQRFLWVGNPGK